MVNTGATLRLKTEIWKFLRFDESFQPKNPTVELAMAQEQMAWHCGEATPSDTGRSPNLEDREADFHLTSPQLPV